MMDVDVAFPQTRTSRSCLHLSLGMQLAMCLLYIHKSTPLYSRQVQAMAFTMALVKVQCSANSSISAGEMFFANLSGSCANAKTILAMKS